MTGQAGTTGGAGSLPPVGFFQYTSPGTAYRYGSIHLTTQIMNFAYTILYVENVEQSLAFYNAAFGLTTRFLHESGAYGELETGATALAFSSRELMTSLGKHPQRADHQNPTFEIAFSTEDVQAAVERAVQAGARLVQAPEDMPWGQTVAYVADRDGYLVELCTPMGAQA